MMRKNAELSKVHILIHSHSSNLSQGKPSGSSFFPRNNPWFKFRSFLMMNNGQTCHRRRWVPERLPWNWGPEARGQEPEYWWFYQFQEDPVIFSVKDNISCRTLQAAIDIVLVWPANPKHPTVPIRSSQSTPTFYALELILFLPYTTQGQSS